MLSLFRLLDVILCRSLEAIRLQYADVLRRWLMVSKATEMLKYCHDWPSIEPLNGSCCSPGLIMFLQCKDELDVSDAECDETRDDA